MQGSFVLTILLLAGFQSSLAGPQMGLGINYLGGSMLVHTKKIHTTASAYVQGMEFSYIQKGHGSKYWHRKYGYPETSLNMSFASYSRPDLGWAVGIYPAIQFSLFESRKLNWYFRLGGGFGYASKPWSRLPYSDSSNNILGSHFNNFTMLQTGVRWAINSHWQLNSGVHFFHVSNAAARQPNYGMNTLGFYLGAVYMPRPWQKPKQEAPEKSPYKKWTAGLTFTTSYAEDKAVNGPIFRNYTVGLLAGYHWRNKFKTSVGFDGAYSARLQAFYKNNYLYPGEEFKHAWRYSAFVNHEFLFGRVGLPLQLGVYLNKPMGGEAIYQKVGLNYHLIPASHRWMIRDMVCMLQLKTHYASAEYVECGLGFFF
ncbi:MAG: acyloxyacyl hydrolase [Chitinophagaceae bacterium]|nr:acyloxyacyl hydrolase [Chitinophagaceae bacterium]